MEKEPELNELVIVGALLVLLEEVADVVSRIPRQTGGKNDYIFVDTSVLIDGRILAVAQSGFITATLAIPRSVMGELQLLADNADSEKRSRARHGMDVAKELQDMKNVSVELFQDSERADEGVDNRLLSLAKTYDGALCTIDYNLSKVAEVEGIRICNVNELAKNLRMAYLPGEKTKIELVQKGESSHQGVGYLPDGTMVVVEQASGNIGQTVEVEFIRSLQTAAGKMMFAKKLESSGGRSQPKSKTVTAQITDKKSRRPRTSTNQNRRQPKPSGSQQNQNSIAPRKRRSMRDDHEDALVKLANS